MKEFIERGNDDGLNFLSNHGENVLDFECRSPIPYSWLREGYVRESAHPYLTHFATI